MRSTTSRPAAKLYSIRGRHHSSESRATPREGPDTQDARYGGNPLPQGSRTRLKLYAWLLDSSIRLPGGFRIGLDGLIGLIPVVGDFFAALLSGGIVAHAYRTGASNSVILRMLGNIVLELIIGAIPIVGDIFDFVFKANQRNVALLESHSLAPAQTRRRSNLIVAAVASAVFLALFAVAAAIWQLLSLLIAALGAL